MLTKMRFLPIRERALRHTRELGVRVSHSQLKYIYRRHGVRFRQPKVSSRLPDSKEAALIPQRILFAEKMKTLIDAGRVIIYADESTFQVTANPGKTWMKGHRLVAPRNL